MGFLSDKPLADLIRALKDKYSITTLVETGTEHGVSALAASEIFDRVVTVEYNEVLAQAALTNSKRWPRNIEFVHGDSVRELPSILAGLTRPAMFWLDAHSIDNCPLIDELNVIGSGHVILIDDARQVHWWYHWRSDPRINWPCLPVVEDWAASHGYAMEIHEHDVIVLTPNV